MRISKELLYLVHFLHSSNLRGMISTETASLVLNENDVVFVKLTPENEHELLEKVKSVVDWYKKRMEGK